MPLSPELARLPGITASFYRAGLMGELIAGMAKGQTDRNLVVDARKLIQELHKHNDVSITGLDRIPKDTGCLIVFNHPNINTLIPAMLGVMVGIYDQTGKQTRLAMGSEITMTSANFNEKSALPGSVWLLKRFHRMYPKNIISVPTAQNRSDFLSGRTIAIRKMMRAFANRDIVCISPEGHVEKDGVISPISTYHEGSGKLAMLATKMGIPTIPIAIWAEHKKISVHIGQPFSPHAKDATAAATELMRHIAANMPDTLKGPFK